jgi:hypothetical protein
MATSKSTVLGIRLDHDRRAWVEAEAARRGVSMRGLFEGMIDGARTGDAEEAGRAIAGLGSATAAVTNVDECQLQDVSKTVGADAKTGTEGARSSGSLPLGSSPWPDLGSVTALPGGMIRGALSLTTGLVKTSGRCALSRLERCPVTKHLSGRSA